MDTQQSQEDWFEYPPSFWDQPSKTAWTNLAATLAKLVGMKKVKQQLFNWMKQRVFEHRAEKNETHNTTAAVKVNVCLLGSPGVGKTMLAKTIHNVLRDLNTEFGEFVETLGSNLKENSLQEKFDAAKDGTLFIDEAYQLLNRASVNSKLTGLMNPGEGPRIIVVAGYSENMRNWLEHGKNAEGLKSRFKYTYELPDYNAHELVEIGQMLVKNHDNAALADDSAKRELLLCATQMAEETDAGNGRAMLTLIENATAECQHRMVMLQNPPEKMLLTDQDIKGGFREWQRAREAMRPKHTKPLASKHAGDVNEWPDPLMITRKGKGGSTSSTYERVKDDDGSPVNEVNKQGVLCPKYQCACGGEVLFNANTKPHITRAEHEKALTHKKWEENN